jgi:hypothetical protein
MAVHVFDAARRGVLRTAGIVSLRRRDVGAPARDTAALAQPTPQVFESTAPGYDGEPVTIVATATPGNEMSGRREPHERSPSGTGAYEHLEGPGTHAIQEGSGHPAGQRGRWSAWLVVAVIAAGFAIAGVGLILAQPWLFGVGLGIAVVGGGAGWATGIMRDERDEGAPTA